MCSLRRFHAQPTKTAGVLLLSSKASEGALDVVFPHGLRLEAKCETQFVLVHHLLS